MAEDRPLISPIEKKRLTEELPEKKQGVPALHLLEDPQIVIEEIGKYESKLDDLFDPENYPIVAHDFIHKKTHLYQWEDKNKVIDRAEAKARIRSINKELLNENMPLLSRQQLEKEKQGLEENVSKLQAESNVSPTTTAELMKSKQNRLRTNWSNFVFGEMQGMAKDFSPAKLGYDFHFEALEQIVLNYRLMLRDYLHRESLYKKTLEDITDELRDPNARARVEQMQQDLKEVYMAKQEFVGSGMDALYRIAKKLLERFKKALETRQVELPTEKTENAIQDMSAMIGDQITVETAVEFQSMYVNFCKQNNLTELQEIAERVFVNVESQEKIEQNKTYQALIDLLKV